MRIALIKTSSMGDVIHALPVVTDIITARPEVEIDWVVEEGFAELPRLHHAVREVIPVAIRRWRRALKQKSTWAEIRALRARLRARRYDLAIDLQGLVKSALVARWTGAPVAGFSRKCVREPIAALAYSHRYFVDPDQHAIERLRGLAGQALGYSPQGLPRFALQAPGFSLLLCPRPPYVVFLHATARAEKRWPWEYWVSLGQVLADRGISVVLPWGSDAEFESAQAIGLQIGLRGFVPPKMSLGECARLLADAHAVVGVDTGLTHLAAALGAPTVALFAATPAWRYGPYWSERARNLGDDGVWPRPGQVLDALAELDTR